MFEKHWPKIGWGLFMLTLLLVAILSLSGKIKWNGQEDSIAKSEKTSTTTSDLNSKPENPTTELDNSEFPGYVLEVLNYVKEHKKPMDDYVGGRNFGNREKKLPITDQSGKRIQYQEWDVHPHKKEVNRGAERLVTSNTGKAYYTKDHYQTFTEITQP